MRKAIDFPALRAPLLRARLPAANPLTLAGAAVLAVMITAVLLAPVLAPYASDEMRLAEKLQGPSPQHLLGTDQFGRDILSRVLYGGRVSLWVSVAGVVIAMIVGVPLGALAGYGSRRLDEVIMRLMDVLMAFPYIILAIAMIAIVGPSVRNIVLVIAFTRTAQFARITRASVLGCRVLEYVQAARALGSSEARILLRHIFPNILTPLAVQASLSLGTAVLTEGTLSFLGLGIQLPQASWGTTIADGRRFMLDAPWIATFPGVAIALTVLAYNLLGDGLRDMLDPRLRRKYQATERRM